MRVSGSEQSSFRPEIQGIRTIGALLVACFHIWGGRVSGGVDVFFVISGFLITGSLVRELGRSHTIDVLAFWGRIARRVAPMAYVVLAATLLAALIWMPQSRQASFLEQVVYSALHLENFKLMMNAVDYLARDEAPSPVQQFWALSVQVQFYALWPFLLMAVAVVARRVKRDALVHGLVLAGLLLVSLAYSVIQTRIDPSPTYFNTLARLWEFALGGLLAVALPHLVVPARLRWMAGWIGLVLVVSCGFVIPAKAHYPGYVALWPTLGAALVLVSGGSGLRFGADRLLSARPLVALGEISFSFYLWHWPVLIFALLMSGKTQLGPRGGLAVIAIALCAAYVSMCWLEQPVQRSSLGRKRVWHVHAAAAAMAVPVLVSAAGWLVKAKQGEMAERQVFSLAHYPGGSMPASLETATKHTQPVRPTPSTAKKDLPRSHFEGCLQDRREMAVVECVYGNKANPSKTIALVGGSHSQHWLPALEVLAEEHGWRIVTMMKSACPLDANESLNPVCVQWNAHVIERLVRLRPDAVITRSTRRRTVDGERQEYIPSGYLDQWQHLADAGLSVVAIRDNPWLGFNVPECMENNSADILKCSRQRRQILNEQDPALLLSPKPESVAFIDLTDRFCDDSLCYPTNGNVLIYSDSHHIGAIYNRSLARPLGERMNAVRPDLFGPFDNDRKVHVEAGQ